MSVAPAPLPPPGGPPAGWYPDPSGVGVRYFDGARWAPSPAAAPSAAPAVPREPHPTLPFSAALGAIVILAVSLVVQHVVARQLDDTDLPLLVTVAIGITLAYGPSLWWCRRVAGANGGAAAIGWRWRWADLGWGPVTWIGSYIAEIIMVLIFIEGLGVPFETNVDTTNDDITAVYVIAMVVSACIAAPLVEELVFRGVVLRGLAGRVGIGLAIPIQGVLFGAAHIDPIDRGWGNLGLMIGLATVGCGFGLAAALTRRIGAPIIAHALLNGVVLTLVLTGVADDLDNDVATLAATALILIGL